MIRRLALALFALAVFAPAGNAQFEFDKPYTEPPLPNPSATRLPRDEMLAAARVVLAKKDFVISKDSCDPSSGVCTLVTDPFVFAKGIMASEQLDHFAEFRASDVHRVSRGRVTVRIELSPTSPTTSTLGVYGTFEGLSQGTAATEWVGAESRGLLEDEIMRCIIDYTKGVVCDRNERESLEDKPTKPGSTSSAPRSRLIPHSGSGG